MRSKATGGGAALVVPQTQATEIALTSGTVGIVAGDTGAQPVG